MSQRILNTGNQILDSRPNPRVERNRFDNSHSFRFSFNMGALIPSCVIEMNPGDHVNCSSELFLRMQPMAAPVMDNLTARVEYFFVSYRVLWAKFMEFYTGDPTGGGLPAMPFLNEPNALHQLGDYLGLPISSSNVKVNALIHAAYQKIVRDWFVDEDLNPGAYNPVLVNGDNGSQYADLNAIRYRNWDRDYFTSAKPFAQKGNAVQIPITNGNPGGYLTVEADSTTGAPYYTIAGTGVNAVAGAAKFGAGGLLEDSLSDPTVYNPDGTLTVPLGYIQAEAGTIEELRRAKAVQSYLEANARGGTRPQEFIWQHFAEHFPDLPDRSEYLGRLQQPVAISEVLNTTGTVDAPQGAMAGHGISVGHNHNNPGSFTAVEPGVFMAVTSVIPQTAYYQGLPRMFSRFETLDFQFPEFANLGEQAILNKEIYFQGTSDDDGVFGYVPRYAEYRMQLNRISGDFRTNLDYWHLARKFANLPVLGPQFIGVPNDDTMDRIFAVIDHNQDHLLAHVMNVCKVTRCMPYQVLPR